MWWQECGDKFCRPCFQGLVIEQLEEGALPAEVKCPQCSKGMSIRDVQVSDPSQPIPHANPLARTYARTHACMLTAWCRLLVMASLLQFITRHATGGGATVHVTGSAGASKRLMKELKMIQKQGGKSLGFTVALVGDSMYEWEVKMFGFNKVQCFYQSCGSLLFMMMLLLLSLRKELTVLRVGLLAVAAATAGGGGGGAGPEGCQRVCTGKGLG